MNEEAVIRLRLDTGNLPAASDTAAKSLGRIGTAGETSARQTAAAMRQLPAQLTDIVTSLQGGQNPLTVLLQQGGQIKDSFGGVGNAIRGIGAAISPTTAIALGLAAALGGVAYEAYAGYEATAALRKSLAQTGNIAGLTVDNVDALSRAIASNNNITIGSARETAAALVEQGTLTKGAFEAAGNAAAALSRLSGDSAAEIAKSFAGAADAPTAFALKLNTQYHFLTASLYEQIRALEAHGQRQEAARLMFEALGVAMRQRTEPAVSSLDKALQSLRNSWSEQVDYVRQLHREVEDAPKTFDTLIEKLKQLLALRNGGAIAPAGFLPGTFTPVTTDADAEAARESKRLADHAAQQLAEEKKLRELSAAHQAALLAVARAGNAARLAEDLRAFEAGHAALEQLFRRNEISAADYQSTLFQIDRATIDRQISNVNALKAAEAARNPGSSEEGRLQQQAALLQIEAQRTALLEKRDKLLADEASGRRNQTPQVQEALASDALRAFKAQDEANVKAYTDAQRLREQDERDFLQQLRDDNARAAAELIQDEQAKGEALIALDRAIAQRRLDQNTELTGSAKETAAKLLDERADIGRRALDRQGVYADLHGAIESAVGDANPGRKFAQTLADNVRARLARSIADTLSNLVFGGGAGGGAGLFGSLIGLLGGTGGGGINGGAVLPDSLRGQNNYEPPPELATGTNYVPRDMIVKVHRGEAVQPKAYNPAAGGRGAGAGINFSPTYQIDGRLDQQQTVATMQQVAYDAQRALLEELRATGQLR